MTRSFSFHIGESDIPVEVEFTGYYERGDYPGDYGGYVIEDVTITDKDGADLTEKATKEEMQKIIDKAVEVARDCEDGTPED